VGGCKDAKKSGVGLEMSGGGDGNAGGGEGEHVGEDDMDTYVPTADIGRGEGLMDAKDLGSVMALFVLE
jgi:hypothetical protein